MSSRGGRRAKTAAAAAAARRQKETAKKKEALMRNKRSRTTKSTASSSAEMSSRGIRERTKWRKKQLEKQEKEKRIQKEAELLKKKIDEQKKRYKKRFQVYETLLSEAAAQQKAVEWTLFDYRQYKNVAKEKIQTEANDIIECQKSEKMMRDEYAHDLQEKWYVRLWKFLY